MTAGPGSATRDVVRASADLPPHGTTARAKGRPAAGVPGCGCQRCRTAVNRYNKRRRVLNATGRPVIVPATTAVGHLRALKAAGMSWPGMVAATGCSSATIAALLRGQEVMRRSVAQRILAVRPAPSLSLPVDATGSIRRVRALYAAGHLQRVIAVEAGLHQCTVSDLLAGRLTVVRAGTAAAVRSAFEALEMRPAPDGLGAVRARNRGVREGWAVPLAWGEDIDDPRAKPSGYAPRPLREPVAA